MAHNAMIFIAMGLFYVAIIVIVIIAANRQYSKIKKKLMLSKEQLKDFSKFNGSKTLYKNKEYMIKYQKGSKNSPPAFSIQIDIKTLGRFKIALETAFDRFAAKMNISRKIITGDNNFDNRFHIDSDTVSFTQAFLSNKKVREQIEKLFDIGFTEIKLTKKTLTVLAHLNKSKISIDEKLIEEVFENISVMNDSLLGLSNYQIADRGIINKIKISLYSLTGLLGIIGLIAFMIGILKYNPLDSGRMFLSSLLYSIAGIVIYMYFSLQFLKGRSSSHKDLMVIFIISIFSFIIAGYGFMIFGNGRLDKSMPQSHEVTLVKKYYRRNKNGKTYYALLDSWRSDRIYEKIRVSRRFYNQLRSGMYLEIETKKGKFGYEWIKDYRKIEFIR